MELALIGYAFLLAFIFWVFHVIVIRTFGDRGIFGWLLRSFFVTGFAGFVILLIILKEPLGIKLLLSILVVTMYALMVFSYIQGIFGITITSVRIQILGSIFQSGKHGMTQSELLRTYNRRTIFEARLHRLVTSGEIAQENGKYRIARGFSPFLLHMRIQDIMLRLFNDPHLFSDTHKP